MADFTDLLSTMTLRLLTLALGCASLLALTGCPHDEDDAPQRPVRFNTPQKHQNTQADGPTTSIPPDDAEPPQSTPRHATPQISQDPPPSTGPAAPQGDYPYGVPVNGKPGFVTSPYAPDSGYVDVHGYATGQEVRDPYTQKIFLVP